MSNYQKSIINYAFRRSSGVEEGNRIIHLIMMHVANETAISSKFDVDRRYEKTAKGGDGQVVVSRQNNEYSVIETEMKSQATLDEMMKFLQTDNESLKLTNISQKSKNGATALSRVKVTKNVSILHDLNRALLFLKKMDDTCFQVKEDEIHARLARKSQNKQKQYENKQNFEKLFNQLIKYSIS